MLAAEQLSLGERVSQKTEQRIPFKSGRFYYRGRRVVQSAALEKKSGMARMHQPKPHAPCTLKEII